ncbi:hypothetical protein ACOME3_004626 [Neoechinorhynchus agilis]
MENKSNSSLNHEENNGLNIDEEDDDLRLLLSANNADAEVQKEKEWSSYLSKDDLRHQPLGHLAHLPHPTHTGSQDTIVVLFVNHCDSSQHRSTCTSSDPSHMQSYTEQFMRLQPDLNGVLNRDQALEFFSKSNMPMEEIETIFKLADNDRDNCLNLEEFVLAMHMIVASMKQSERYGMDSSDSGETDAGRESPVLELSNFSSEISTDRINAGTLHAPKPIRSDFPFNDQHHKIDPFDFSELEVLLEKADDHNELIARAIESVKDDPIAIEELTIRQNEFNSELANAVRQWNHVFVKFAEFSIESKARRE